MLPAMNTRIFQLPTPFRDPIRRKIFAPVQSLLERWLMFHQLNDLYSEIVNGDEDEARFFEKVLGALNLRYRVLESDLARIPKNGPIIVTANHPFGGVEGIILAAVLRSVRPDVKVMANHLLACIPEARRHFIFVDPFEKKSSTRANLAPVRESLAFLREGGMLGVFPAGEVAHWQAGKRIVTDPEWKDTVARLARATGAGILPVYFDGHNGALFQMAGVVHPRLRTAMLPYEFLNKRNRSIEVRVGNPIAWNKLKGFETDAAVTAHLRERTYRLADRTSEEKRTVFSFPNPFRSSQRAEVEPVVSAGPRELLAAEVAALGPEALMAESGDMAVICAEATRIPHIVREIGRLREITFRAAGEGTGKSLDIDAFDPYYLHLFLWNREKQEIAGGYRIGRTDEILDRFGKRGLYTSTLFDYKTGFLNGIGPALELGRSFVIEEYQRGYAPLLLLWKGIGRFVVRNPHYRVLFGPVSITNDYHSASRRMMVEFLKAQNFLPQLAKLVRARTPYQPLTATLAETLFGRPEPIQATDIEEVSDFVADIEPDAKGVPVLLRQYLKLGGKLLAFNVDPNFNNALDGLIFVDLAQTDRKTLERYMGKDGAGEFLAEHQAGIRKAG
jgi:putative hemolysin